MKLLMAFILTAISALSLTPGEARCRVAAPAPSADAETPLPFPPSPLEARGSGGGAGGEGPEAAEEEEEDDSPPRARPAGQGRLSDYARDRLEAETQPVRRESPAVPVAVAEPPPRPPAPAPGYGIEAGESLRAALSRWSERAGWTLAWDAGNDYAFAAGAGFSGDFQTAVTGLMETLRNNGTPFAAELYTGNRVLRLVRNR